MTKLELLFLCNLLLFGSLEAFIVTVCYKRQQVVAHSSLPSIEELQNDPFVKQVQHGAKLCSALKKDPAHNDVYERINVQLGSSDGIRGFMVSYLTTEGLSPKDLAIPDGLAKVLRDATRSNPEELVPLAFMNVIMPVAMSSIHDETELRQSSALTARRGVSVLTAMAGEHPSIMRNAEAILDVAMNNEVEEDSGSTLAKYWTKFFEKWGYKDEQKKDIAEAMSIFLSSNYDK